LLFLFDIPYVGTAYHRPLTPRCFVLFFCDRYVCPEIIIDATMVLDTTDATMFLLFCFFLAFRTSVHHTIDATMFFFVFCYVRRSIIPSTPRWFFFVLFFRYIRRSIIPSTPRWVFFVLFFLAFRTSMVSTPRCRFEQTKQTKQEQKIEANHRRWLRSTRSIPQNNTCFFLRKYFLFYVTYFSDC
jgi:hypothetical protein